LASHLWSLKPLEIGILLNAWMFEKRFNIRRIGWPSQRLSRAIRHLYRQDSDGFRGPRDLVDKPKKAIQSLRKAAGPSNFRDGHRARPKHVHGLLSQSDNRVPFAGFRLQIGHSPIRKQILPPQLGTHDSQSSTLQTGSEGRFGGGSEVRPALEPSNFRDHLSRNTRRPVRNRRSSTISQTPCLLFGGPLTLTRRNL